MWSEVPFKVLDTRVNPLPPPSCPGWATFHQCFCCRFFFWKVQRTSYMGIINSSPRGWGRWHNSGASCLTSVGRVTLAGGTTFSHIYFITLCLAFPGRSFVCRLSRDVSFFGLSKSTKCILNKENRVQQRLQWSNQRQYLRKIKKNLYFVEKN